ncbi:hypothetical protein LPJ66_004672 [Kickxella alabastrina]|uniref:Uncharacterized protein n=1 Tax=Kickxella alabastrina TaxID=61397 RepID=A0ACC1IME3_9FUNG|nr:hypothetical protein LPJ66_004672 [Kickxella alabastrina]
MSESIKYAIDSHPKHSIVEADANAGLLEQETSVLTGIGLCIIMFMIGLYSTMDSVVFIPIANHFNALSQAEWIINGYLITTTAFQPIYGKISDIVGRVPAILFASTMLLIGSLVCAISQTLAVMIIGRAIQGLGTAGMFTMANVLVADLYSERARGKFMGLSSGVWSLASSGGLVLGGVLVQFASWRVIFWLNLPISVIIAAVVIYSIRLPKPSGTMRYKIKRVDFGGTVISLLSIVLILLALAWGGREYPWNSAIIICFLVFGVLTGALFIFYEHRVPTEPIIPLHLLHTRNNVITLIAQLFFGSVANAPLFLVPKWALLVKNTTPVTSGLYLLPYNLAEFAAVVVSGWWVTRTGRYRECVWLGSTMLLVGLTPLIVLDQNSGLGIIIGFQIVAGMGFGVCIHSLLLTAQVNADGLDSASTTSVSMFMRSIGSITIVAVLGSVYSNKVNYMFAEVTRLYPEYADKIALVAENQTLIRKLDLPPAVYDLLVDAFMRSMRAAFIALIPFSVSFILMVAGIKHKPLQVIKKTTIK